MRSEFEDLARRARAVRLTPMEKEIIKSALLATMELTATAPSVETISS